MSKMADLSEHVRQRIRAELKAGTAHGAEQTFSDSSDPRKITVRFPDGRLVYLKADVSELAPGYAPSKPLARTTVKSG
jgi:hypothetical protein